MNTSKLIETVKLFSEKELDMLHLFLSSPYFIVERNHAELLALYEYILQYQNNWQSPELEKEKAYQSLFPFEPEIKGKMDKLMSALLHEIHRFVIQHIDTKEREGFNGLMKLSAFFSKRKQTKYAAHYLEKARKILRKTKIEDGENFYNKYLLSEEDIKKSLVHAKQALTFDFPKALLPLDAFYLLRKLEHACSLLSYHQFRREIKVEPLVKFLVAAKPLFEEQGILDIPIVKVYFQVFELLNRTTPAKDGYWVIKNIIAANGPLFSEESYKALSGLARNFIIRDFNEGKLALLPEIFALHKDHLEKGYLYYEDGLLAGRLKNLVTLGISAKEFDWVYAFLEKYKNRIKGISTPQDVYHFNLAYYYFATKKYDKAFELLADKYEDVFYKISAKRLEIKIYYETCSEILDAKMDAFKIYIYRIPNREILNYKRLCNNHFIDFLRQIRNPKTATNDARFAKLAEKIKACQHLSEREWLLEKLKALKM